MRSDGYRNAFGTAPESFRRRMASSLLEAKEERVVKRKIGAGVVLALVLGMVVLVGAAYAVFSQWGFVDYVDQNLALSLPADVRALLAPQDEPLITFEVDGVEVTVTQAVADTEFMYISGVFRSLDANVKLLPSYAELPVEGGPYRRVDALAAIELMSKGQTNGGSAGLLEWKLNNPQLQDDQKTYVDYVKELKWRVLDLARRLTPLPDGRVGFVLASELKTEEEVLDVEIFGVVVEENEIRYERRSVAIPIHQQREIAEYTGAKSVESGLVAVNTVRLVKTPLNVYCIAYLDVDPAFRRAIISGWKKYPTPLTDNIHLYFHDAEGNRLQNGIAMYQPALYFLEIPIFRQTLPLDELPEVLPVEVCILRDGIETTETLLIEKQP